MFICNKGGKIWINRIGKIQTKSKNKKIGNIYNLYSGQKCIVDK